MFLRTVLGAALAGSVLVGVMGAAEAQVRKARDGAGSVTACSRYGHGCQTAPVRRGQFDYEYRLPNGTWMPCKQSCKDAFREDVIDYWETLNEREGER
ncbi:hypothetical protein [Hyphomicrobium sp. CS1BSMeth3]|uniref:hypothetical protein n=1 Tax=Hyphomicrobium sp. CS1BSMeth3 TaxID=1892844 RepID=UPI000930AB92|nr:hypothetical protein [Hyphomicrobium sp. CS1BSMeth3]